MNNNEDVLALNKEKLLKTIVLIEASLKKLRPYETNKIYSPEELEPYDAVSGRFIRAVEMGLKYFRSLEKYFYGENSDTLRDLLNRMEKLGFITSTDLWMEMREVRNRIVHDYLPEQIKALYDSIMYEYSKELLNLKDHLKE